MKCRKADLLDIVFAREEVIFRSSTPEERAAGVGKQVAEYFDIYGKPAGHARQIRGGFGRSCVQFYNQEGIPTVRARVRKKGWGGYLVEYIDDRGEVLHSEYVGRKHRDPLTSAPPKA